MENASKALLIAGGMLIAMLILSMIISLAISMQDVAESQDKQQLKKQVEQFNKEYLAYNKTKMFGADVITVLNKAIDYNKTLDTNEEEYKINIILKLKQDFDRTEQIITQDGKGNIKEGEIKVLQEGTLKKGTYQIFKKENSIEINDDIIKFLNYKSDDKIEKKYGTTVTTTFTYSAITSFKTAVFKCENVEYGQATGRISSMTFSQI